MMTKMIGERTLYSDCINLFKTLTEQELENAMVVFNGKAFYDLEDDKMCLIVWDDEKDVDSFANDFENVEWLSNVKGGKELDDWFNESGICYTDWSDCLVMKISKDQIQKAKELISPDELIGIATSKEFILMVPNDMEKGFENIFERAYF